MQTSVQQIQVCSYFVVPGLFGLVDGGGFCIRILSRIGEVFAHQLFVGIRHVGHNRLFALPHHVILQTGLQQVGEHLHVVASRTVTFADRCIHIPSVSRKVILQSKLGQQLKIILINVSLVARLYGQRRLRHHLYFADDDVAPLHFSLDAHLVVQAGAGVVIHLHTLIIQA